MLLEADRQTGTHRGERHLSSCQCTVQSHSQSGPAGEKSAPLTRTLCGGGGGLGSEIRLAREARALGLLALDAVETRLPRLPRLCRGMSVPSPPPPPIPCPAGLLPGAKHAWPGEQKPTSFIGASSRQCGGHSFMTLSCTQHPLPPPPRAHSPTPMHFPSPPSTPPPPCTCPHSPKTPSLPLLLHAPPLHMHLPSPASPTFPSPPLLDMHPPPNHWIKETGSYCSILPGTLWRSHSTCDRTPTNAFHRVRGLCVWLLFKKITMPHRQPHTVSGGYIWRVGAVTQGAYHGCRQSPHNYAAHNNTLM